MIKKSLLRLKCFFRMMFKECPECNSDAPAIYDCPICSGGNLAHMDWVRRRWVRRDLYQKHNL